MKLKVVKSAIVFGLILVVLGCVIQYEPIETTEVINIPDQSKESIYNKTRQWFSEVFVSGESVIDYENPEIGTIIGNGRGTIGSVFLITHEIEYKIRIDIKDGKLRVSAKILRHINHTEDSTYTVTYKITKNRDQKAINYIKKTVENMELYITKQRQDW